MTHPTEEQLVLYFYGEADDFQELAKHLDECPSCRTELNAIRRTLNVVEGMKVPERGPDYGEQVWKRVSPHVRRRMRLWPEWLSPRRLAAGAAVATLVIAAYLAGRLPLQRTTREPQELASSSVNAQMRNRLLLANLGDHLERSQMMLVQLANDEGDTLRGDQPRVEDLLAANRLYRQSAKFSGDAGVQELLDELGQLLTEVSNAPPGELEQIKRRMVDRDILFKIRALNAQVRARQLKALQIFSD